MKKTVIVFISCILVLCAYGLPAAAATVAGETVEVKLKVGDENLYINGVKSIIKKPFMSKDSTLVPLRVITTAFGAILTWDPGTQGINLQYGDLTIELTVGSDKALVNGVETTIPAVPTMVDGTTMVPLRFITENFGATIKYDNVTKEIVLIGIKVNTDTDESSSSINSDAGKTKVGDSHFGWSMHYPTGLVKENQGFNGNYVKFVDAKGKYIISVFAEKNDAALEPEDLLDELSKYPTGTVIDKRLFKSEEYPYAKIVFKEESGSYTESRAYLSGDYIYYYSFTINEEDEYKNETTRVMYQEWMNSFKPEFDKKDNELKDISPVKDGYIHYSDNDYGLSLQLPSDWFMITMDRGLYFYEPESGNSLAFAMSSLDDGDTLSKWVLRNENRYKQEYAEKYRELESITNKLVAGSLGQGRYMSYSYGSSNWRQLYDLFFIKGHYKFNLTFSYKKTDRTSFQQTLEKILKSVSIDSKFVEETFGYVEDEYDIDLTSKRTYTNKTYNYTVKFPRYWSKEETEDKEAELLYSYDGGTFMINVFEGSIDYNQFIQQIESSFAETSKFNPDYRVLESSSTMFSGISARKYLITSKDEDGNPFQDIVYLFKHGEYIYAVEATIFEGSRTPENLQRMNEALQSFTVTP